MSLLVRDVKFASSINEKHHSKSRFQKVIMNDLDKGRGCRNCGEMCPGLQLHVWRKVCQHCSCPWESHDVEIIRGKPKVKPKPNPKVSSNVTRKGISFSETPEIIPDEVRSSEICQIRIVLDNVSNDPETDLHISPLASPEEIKEDSTTESPLSPVENADTETSEDESPDSSVLKETYLWYPSDIDLKIIEDFMGLLPQEIRPIKGAEAAHNCISDLIRQLPPQDTDHERCHPLSEKELSIMQKFVSQRENKYRDRGVVQCALKGSCVACQQAFIQDEICILAPLIGSSHRYHVNCFRCCCCSNFLQDLHYYKKGKEIFCGRHHAELFGKRCAGCDEIIFSDQVIEAEGKNWHSEHFCCKYCDQQLGGDDYVKTRNIIMCNKCFTEQINAVCYSCKKAIQPEGSVVKHREKSWHQKCFICSVCDKFLKAEKFIVKGTNLFCIDCFENSQSEMKPKTEVASNCDTCQQPVDVHDPHMSSDAILWHTTCFACVFCKQDLVGKTFLRHKAGLLCEACYGERMAHTCNNCLGKIVKGGVKHNERFFHQDCFNCAKCEVQLANIKFSTRNGVNLCFSCSKKSSPICHQCSKEIVGDCFEFKGYNFHPDCFKCTGCDIGIARKDFYQTRGAIYCKHCAKRKSKVTQVA